MPNAIMMFAAGFGTRMGALTANQPKPLVPVRGKPLFQHALDIVQEHGALRCVANVHYQAEKMTVYAEKNGVRVSPEFPDILDTGGGLRQALPLLKSDPVFTLNTDAVWQGPNPLDVLQAAWRPEDMDALLLCVPLKQTVGHVGNGDFLIAPDGQISRGRGMAYTGVQILKTDSLSGVEDTVFSLNKVWDLLAERGRLFGVPYDGIWCDVGTPKGVKLAEEMLEKQGV